MTALLIGRREYVGDRRAKQFVLEERHVYDDTATATAEANRLRFDEGKAVIIIHLPNKEA